MPHLIDQAHVATRVMQHYQADEETFVVAGHSYGGAVAEQLLLDFPLLVNKAIYAGGTVSPEMQESKWFNYLADFGLINIVLPKPFQTSNIEMMGLTASLKKNTKRLMGITQPIIYIQGKKDVLVPFETVTYYKKNKPIGVKYIIDEEMNHFIPWSHPELVIEAIMD